MVNVTNSMTLLYNLYILSSYINSLHHIVKSIVKDSMFCIRREEMALALGNAPLRVVVGS